MPSTRRDETMMCHDVEELLSAFLEGELVPIDAEKIEAHLSGCTTCRQFAETLKGLGGFLRDSCDEPEFSEGELRRKAALLRQSLMDTPIVPTGDV